MYDTIKCYLRSDEIKDSNFFDKIPSKLNKVSITNRDNGITFIKGEFDNLYISLSQLGISLNGSLTKFYNGNNYEKLTRQQTELSIQKIEDYLNINFGDAQMNRIDISHNFLMDQPTSNYYYLLGKSNYYDRLKQPNSIYYNNHKKVKLFYDKILECKSKKIQIPSFLKNRNLLRYELRLMNRINKQLNKDIKLRSLYNEDVYMSCIDLWIDEYNSINKNKLFQPMENELTPKTAKEILLSALVDKVGINEVLELTNQWNDSFTNSKAKNRFIKELNNLKGLTKESELIFELDKKVNSVKEFYR